MSNLEWAATDTTGGMRPYNLDLGNAYDRYNNTPALFTGRFLREKVTHLADMVAMGDATLDADRLEDQCRDRLQLPFRLFPKLGTNAPSLAGRGLLSKRPYFSSSFCRAIGLILPA